MISPIFLLISLFVFSLLPPQSIQTNYSLKKRKKQNKFPATNAPPQAAGAKQKTPMLKQSGFYVFYFPGHPPSVNLRTDRQVRGLSNWIINPIS
jgi:poly-D-alanine transfer protein DltD